MKFIPNKTFDSRCEPSRCVPRIMFVHIRLTMLPDALYGDVCVSSSV